MKKSRIITLLLVLCLCMSFQTTVFAGGIEYLEFIDHIDSTWGVSAVVASPNSDMLLIQEMQTWNIYLYNINSGIKKELVNTLSYGVGIYGMCFSLDGSMCAVTSYGSWDNYQHSISVFDTRSGEQISTVSVLGHLGPYVFSQDNNLIVRSLYGDYGSATIGIVVKNVRTDDAIIIAI